MEAKEQFIKKLKGILDKYPVSRDAESNDGDLGRRYEQQVIFRNAEQYRIGALLKKWSVADAGVTEEEIAKTYFDCVLGHFKTGRYGK
jgi:hypothetical protein